MARRRALRLLPPGRTAIVVIHGIGEQNPFETLDAFTQGLARFLRIADPRLGVQHRLGARRDARGAAWSESYLRLRAPGGRRREVDLHEFYWAYLTEKTITAREVWRWIARTARGWLAHRADNLRLQRRDGAGLGERARVQLLIGAVLVVDFVGQPLLAAFAWIRGSRMISAVIRWLTPAGARVVEDYLGDVAVYTTTDQKSAHYRIRQQVLAESIAFVVDLLRDPEVDRVIVAGHSLGSVIAYDTLDRINVRANTPGAGGLTARHTAKLHALVTFGSPLDKIVFFFREQVGKGQQVRRQIIRQLHSFKSRLLDEETGDLRIASTIKARLDGMRWYNYWSRRDPVSGRLDFYDIPPGDNREVPLKERYGVAHVGYWRAPAFYRRFVEDVLLPLARGR